MRLSSSRYLEPQLGFVELELQVVAAEVHRPGRARCVGVRDLTERLLQAVDLGLRLLAESVRLDLRVGGGSRALPASSRAVVVSRRAAPTSSRASVVCSSAGWRPAAAAPADASAARARSSAWRDSAAASSVRAETLASWRSIASIRRRTWRSKKARHARSARRERRGERRARAGARRRSGPGRAEWVVSLSGMALRKTNPNPETRYGGPASQRKRPTGREETTRKNDQARRDGLS